VTAGPPEVIVRVLQHEYVGGEFEQGLVSWLPRRSGITKIFVVVLDAFEIARDSSVMAPVNNEFPASTEAKCDVVKCGKCLVTRKEVLRTWEVKYVSVKVSLGLCVVTKAAFNCPSGAEWMDVIQL